MSGPKGSCDQKRLFITKIGSPRDNLLSPFEESIRAAQGLSQDYPNQQIFLCISGGVDSECMVQSFIAAGVDFTPVIMRFEGGLNDFDTESAVELCRRLKIPWVEKRLDLDSFYHSSEFLHLADLGECRSPQLVVHFWLFQQLNGVPVAAWNPPLIEPLLNGLVKITLPNDLFMSYQRFSICTGLNVRPYFFLDTPELFYSFLRLNTVQQLLESPGAFTKKYDLDNYFYKCHLYRRGGFSFTDKRYKYTGFEGYKEYLSYKMKTDEHEYTRRFRSPLEERFPKAEHSLSLLNLDFFLLNNAAQKMRHLSILTPKNSYDIPLALPEAPEVLFR